MRFRFLTANAIAEFSDKNKPTMKATWESILRKHQMRHLLEVERSPQKMGRISGFVVDYSESLILLQRFSWDRFQLNGYSVLPNTDIEEYRFFDKREYWQYRAIQHLKLEPKALGGISVSSLPSLLETVAKVFPLLTIHREKINSEVCYIGKLATVSHKSFTIEDLNADAAWTGPRRFRFSDVTLVDFGGGYENALAVTAPKQK
jgi:hypothetical protein